ncbi:hypothetical protein [Roseovarius pacificus]|uniref:hypothetical protein n=1 Tax=Roseovarius pacificus TaxID=337701 RepID=UPI0040390DF6
MMFFFVALDNHSAMWKTFARAASVLPFCITAFLRRASKGLAPPFVAGFFVADSQLLLPTRFCPPDIGG